MLRRAWRSIRFDRVKKYPYPIRILVGLFVYIPVGLMIPFIYAGIVLWDQRDELKWALRSDFRVVVGSFRRSPPQEITF